MSGSNQEVQSKLKNSIRNIKDYPKEGIIFRDITTLLKDGEVLTLAIDQLLESLKDVEFDYILAPESRGFIFGMPVAYALNKGFIPVRKPNRLPSDVIQKEYDLEYGSSILEMHKDAIKAGDKVIIIDDLLATGGTCNAIIQMVEEIGAEVASINFLIELDALSGREVLKNYKVSSIIHY